MKKGKSKGSKQKSELSDIVDQIEIEDEEENEDEVFEPKKRYRIEEISLLQIQRKEANQGFKQYQ